MISKIIFFVIIGIFSIIFLIKKKIYIEKLRDFFSRETNSINLAIFRITVFTCLFYITLGNNPIIYFDIPQELRVILPGYACLEKYLFFSKEFSFIVYIISVIFLFLSIIGLFTRLSMIISFTTSLYILLLPLLFGKIIHYHNLIWFAALLMFSKCYSRLALDSWLSQLNQKNNTHPNYTMSSSLPICFAWICIGIAYFFSGFAKLQIFGDDWIIGDNFRNILYEYWFARNIDPLFRIDSIPYLFTLVKLFMIVFELSFIFLIFSSRFRIFAIIGGLIFHFGLSVFIHKNTWYLVMCYISFIDFHSLFKLKPHEITIKQTTSIVSQQKSRFDKSDRLVSIIGIILILSNSYCGLKQIDSWPFSIHPFFNYYQPAYTKIVSFLVYDNSNNRINIDETKIIEKYHLSRWTYMLKKIGMEKSKQKQKLLCEGLIKLIEKNILNSESICYIKVFKEYYHLNPDRKRPQPFRKNLILQHRFKH